jgi:hypothetical protein
LKLNPLLPLLALLLAIYLLQDAVRDPGDAADFLVLIGATLFALGLVSAFWCVQHYQCSRRLKRHVKGNPHHHAENLGERQALKAQPQYPPATSAHLTSRQSRW